jgi:hypothetical protein
LTTGSCNTAVTPPAMVTSISGVAVPGSQIHHITANPSKIADIVKAALVLTHYEHGRFS